SPASRPLPSSPHPRRPRARALADEHAPCGGWGTQGGDAAAGEGGEHAPGPEPPEVERETRGPRIPRRERAPPRVFAPSRRTDPQRTRHLAAARSSTSW